MYGDRPYGPIHQVDWCEETPPEGRGRAYRAYVELLDVPESNQPFTDRVRVLTSGGAARDWQTGSGGVLAPVAPSRYDIVLTSFRGDWREALAMLMGLPDGYVRMRLLSAPSPDIFDDEDEEDQVTFEWGGYLDQESSFMTVGYRGYELGVSLSFMEGWGFVTGEEPSTNASSRFALRLRAQIDSFLNRVAGGDTVKTWMDWVASIAWRPWEPTGGIVFGSDDPVWSLIQDSRLGPELFGDGNVDSVTFTRLLASRFNARIYQSEGKIYIDQPSMLGRGFDRAFNNQGPGRITQWEATIGSGGADPGAGSIVDRIVDTREWTVIAGSQRAQGSPTNVIESATDVVPDVDNLILNSSFEEFDPIPLGVSHWTGFRPPDAGTFVAAEDLLTVGIPGSGFGQRNAGIVYDDSYGTVNSSRIRNDDTLLYFTGGDDAILEASVDHFQRRVHNSIVIPGIPPPRHMFGRVLIDAQDRDGNLTGTLGMCQLTCVQAVQWSDDMSVYVEGLIPNSPVTNAVEGVVAIPAGTILYFFENDGDLMSRNADDYICTFEVDRDVLWGDTRISGDPTYITPDDDQHDGQMKVGFTCLFACWNPAAGFEITQLNLGPPADRVKVQGAADLFQFLQDIRATMASVDGTPIEGRLRFSILHDRFEDPTDDNITRFNAFADNARLFVSQDGESSIDETLCTTRNEEAPGGNKLDLPVADGSGHIVGDGPIAIDHTDTEGPTADESLSALRVIDGPDTYATARGPDTSWTAGNFQVGDPPEGGGERSLIVAPGIDCLASEDAVRLHTDPTGVGAQQQVQTSWLLKEGQDLRPHQVPLVWLPAYVVSPYSADDTEIRLTFPPSDLTGKFGNFLVGADALFEETAGGANTAGWHGFSLVSGPDVTQNETVEEWGTDRATRIQWTGDGGTDRYQFNVEDLPNPTENGQDYEFIVHLKNDGADPIGVTLADTSTETFVPSGNTEIVKIRFTGDGSSDERIFFRIQGGAGDADITVWNPIFRKVNPPSLDTMEIVVNGEPQTRSTLGPITREIDGYTVAMDEGFTVSLSPGDCVRVGVLCWWTRFRKDDLRGVIDFQGQALVPNDDVAVSHDQRVR